MTQRRRLFVLNNPFAPRLCPELAKEIGLNESILLLQIEFWISISEHYIDGRWWTYQSLRDLQRTFSFWSVETINRSLKRLIAMGLLEVGNFNKAQYDRTRWFAIKELTVRQLSSIQMIEGVSQNETGVSQGETGSSQDETPIPETTPEITTKTTTPPKSPYGEFQNVLLSDSEMVKLLALFGEAGATELIESLSLGISSKGYKYKSHYATILNWARRDGVKAQGSVEIEPIGFSPEVVAKLNRIFAERYLDNEEAFYLGCVKLQVPGLATAPNLYTVYQGLKGKAPISKHVMRVWRESLQKEGIKLNV